MSDRKSFQAEVPTNSQDSDEQTIADEKASKTAEMEKETDDGTSLRDGRLWHGTPTGRRAEVPSNSHDSDDQTLLDETDENASRTAEIERETDDGTSPKDDSLLDGTPAGRQAEVPSDSHDSDDETLLDETNENASKSAEIEKEFDDVTFPTDSRFYLETQAGRQAKTSLDSNVFKEIAKIHEIDYKLVNNPSVFDVTSLKKLEELPTPILAIKQEILDSALKKEGKSTSKVRIM